MGSRILTVRVEERAERRPIRAAAVWLDADGTTDRARFGKSCARVNASPASLWVGFLLERRMQTYLEQRNLLTDVVVQLAGDAGALDLLRIQ